MLWLVLGIIIGFALHWLISQVKNNNLSVQWYQWVLGVGSVAMLLLTVENYIGLQQELEPIAANFVLIAMGLPAVILGALTWFTPSIVQKFTGKSKANTKAAG